MSQKWYHKNNCVSDRNYLCFLCWRSFCLQRTSK